MQNNKKKIRKYTNLYSEYGIAIGICYGLIFGFIFFSENSLLGLSLGLSIGYSLGLSLGSLKDKRLAEKMMEIMSIEEIEATENVVLLLKDKNGIEQQYEITKKKMKKEKFKVGDRIAEEKKGVIVSLEK